MYICNDGVQRKSNSKQLTSHFIIHGLLRRQGVSWKTHPDMLGRLYWCDNSIIGETTLEPYV